ncbi:MAG: hypothetical protein KKD44_17320 [Proteobacteria bacterium]|nr:hypothetical protein [Pseudomonadota bacterium]
MENIKKTIMDRDELSSKEADELIKECLDEIKELTDQVAGMEEIEAVFMDSLGLEPDYLIELLCMLP